MHYAETPGCQLGQRATSDAAANGASDANGAIFVR